MGYIKKPPLRWSITVDTMGKHQAGQEEALVEVRMGMASLEVVHPPRASGGCFRFAVALAAVMGVLVVALLVGFILHYLPLGTSCIQESPSFPLQKRDEQGTYDIFTAHNNTEYLIYGWVTFSSVADDEVTLLVNKKDNAIGTIQRQNISKKKVVFLDTVKLLDGDKIMIRFSPNYTDSSFHIYEL